MQRHQLEFFKTNEADQTNNPRNYREQEQELREMGGNSAISNHNLALNIMHKIGIKLKNSLRVSGSGIQKPMFFHYYNRNTSGCGRDEYIRNIVREKQQNCYVNNDKNAQKKYRNFTPERRIFVALEIDYFKAQRICEELDFRMDVMSPTLPYFWTKLTRAKLRVCSRWQYLTNGEEEKDEDDDEDEINDFNLKEMINYLRMQYNYCIYCDDYADQSDEVCPGYFREDHDQ